MTTLIARDVFLVAFPLLQPLKAVKVKEGEHPRNASLATRLPTTWIVEKELMDTKKERDHGRWL